MEFKTPPEIIKAIKDYAENGFFCYTGIDSVYRKSVSDFMRKHHSWDFSDESIICTGGVVSALNTAVRTFSLPGDGVIIQRPVYYPFSDAIRNNGRQIINNALIKNGDTYIMDFNDLEKKAANKNNKMMILCSPHNPVGRVWNEDELRKVGNICKKYGIILISDEIHFDITNKTHHVITTVDESFKDFTVVCTSVSKSFNLAGLGTSNIIIEKPKLREAFQKQLTADGYSCINSVSRPATIAAYTLCDKWLNEMNNVVNNNFNTLYSFINKELPEITVAKREGTYLAWLDMNYLKLDDEKLNEFLMSESKIIPDPGFWFGDEGKGFARLNLAVPPKILNNSLLSLKFSLTSKI